MKSEVFKTAHALLKGGFFKTFSAALKAAWLKAKVMVGLVTRVAYAKNCGTERHCIIRRVADIQPCIAVVRYFDEGIEGWRSFRLDRVLAFN